MTSIKNRRKSLTTVVRVKVKNTCELFLGGPQGDTSESRTCNPVDVETANEIKPKSTGVTETSGLTLTFTRTVES